MKHWQASKAYFWEAAPFFRLLLPLIIAIICYDKGWLPALSRSTLVAALSVLFSLTITVVLLNKFSRFIQAARIGLIHACIFSGGWLLCVLNDIRNDANWFGKQVATSEVFRVKIIEQPLERTSTWKVKVEVQNSWQKGKAIKAAGKAFIYIYKNGAQFFLNEGDEILVPNRWVQIKNAGNPYEFDYARFCSRNNIHYQQFINATDISLYLKGAQQQSFVGATHDWAMGALNHYIKDKATLGLMQAMLLGDEVNFDPELRQAYVETGIIHIVAISGGHVIIFFEIIGLLFFWLRNKRYDFVKYIVAVPLVCFYVAVAGAPTSAVRAAIMFSFIALGLMLQKDKQPLNQLFTTAFFMLMFEPMWLFSVGFQLSFAAVLSLILFYQPIYRLLPLKNKMLKKIWGAAAASIAAEIIIAPIVIYYFHLLPVCFLFANVIAYLFMSVALFAGLLLIAISTYTSLAGIVAYILIWLVKYFNVLIAFFQQLNPASFKHLYLSLTELLLVYLIITSFAVLFLSKQKKAFITGLTAVCMLLLLLVVRKWEALHQYYFIAYNVNKKNYAEIVLGSKYIPIAGADSINADKDFATKELHIASGAWKEATHFSKDVVRVNGKAILLLNEPLATDSLLHLNIDYVMIAYPLKEFNAQKLQEAFSFRKLIIASNQKRYRAEQWRDSCLKHNIPTHFTMFDGAFVLK